jgi:hypothetical protein
MDMPLWARALMLGLQLASEMALLIDSVKHAPNDK